MTNPPIPRRRILIIDDTPATSYLLRRLLESMGQSVQVFPDGPSALVADESERPDLVISDLSMPGMDGYEVARRLRAREELSQTVLAALSGLSRDSDVEQAHQSGLD